MLLTGVLVVVLAGLSWRLIAAGAVAVAALVPLVITFGLHGYQKQRLMTFLEDDLSVITGAYEDVLSLDEVIDQELILIVSLNTNKNSKAVRALGRMLLQNLQLMIGKRYEDTERRRQLDRPMVSVVLDEFAPFAYSNFAQILQTARGTNTAFLFALQALPQLLEVGRAFRDDVSSAPNTTMLLRTRDEETAKYFRETRWC